MSYVKFWLAECEFELYEDRKDGRIHNSALLAGDSRKMRRMLYPRSVKALLHDTTDAVCSPVLLNWGILYVFSYPGWLGAWGVLVIKHNKVGRVHNGAQ